MDRVQFDAMARGFAASSSRRWLLGALTGSALSVIALSEDAAAKAKKQHYCLNGANVSAKSKRKKRKLRKKGAVRGKCKGCMPTCPAGTCGDDGCGGTCACAVESLCVDGACQACNVTCDSDPATCGAALQAKLSAGGNVVVCPGRYKPETASGFLINHSTPTTVVGAGSGADPDANTVLDQQNAVDSMVFWIGNMDAKVSLSGLHMTGGTGTASGPGGFLSWSRNLLEVDDCSFVGNTGATEGGGFQHQGPLTMTNCLVSGNEATTGPGGIYLKPQSPGDEIGISSSVITGNSADAFGGVLFQTRFSDQSLTVASSTKITGNTITAATGERAGGIAMTTTGDLGSANATGATISGNTSPQCLNIGGCSI